MIILGQNWTRWTSNFTTMRLSTVESLFIDIICVMPFRKRNNSVYWKKCSRLNDGIINYDVSLNKSKHKHIHISRFEWCMMQRSVKRFPSEWVKPIYVYGKTGSTLPLLESQVQLSIKNKENIYLGLSLWSVSIEVVCFIRVLVYLMFTSKSRKKHKREYEVGYIITSILLRISDTKYQLNFIFRIWLVRFYEWWDILYQQNRIWKYLNENVHLQYEKMQQLIK